MDNKKLTKIAKSGGFGSVKEAAKGMRSYVQSFQRSVRTGALKASDLEEFCEACDCEVRVYSKTTGERII